VTTTEPSNLRACILRFAHEDGSPGQMCGYLETEADGTLSFITLEGMELRQLMRGLDEGFIHMSTNPGVRCGCDGCCLPAR
jgi:hypothetical protein